MDLALSLVLLVATLGCHSVLAGDCTLEQLSPCVDQMTSLAQNPDAASDISATCKLLDGVTSCFENLDCEIPSQSKAGMEDMLKTYSAVCEGASASGDCGMQDMQKCVADMANIESSDPAVICKVMEGAKKCFEDLKPNCRNEMKTAIDQQLANLKSNDACAAVKDGCSPMEIQKCGQLLLPGGGDPTMVCKATSEAKKCFSDLSHCSGVEESLKMITEFSSDKCCGRITKVFNECHPGQDFETSFVADEAQCNEMEKAINCLNKYNPQCPGEMQAGIEAARSGLSKNVKDCENNGYNITILSAQDQEDPGNGGITSHPVWAVLLSTSLLGIYSFLF